MLMESLMERAITITELLTGVEWELERDQYQWPLKKDRPNVLNTLWGTDDILTRIRKLPITLSDDTLEDAKFSRGLRQIKEATLILRNMCLLPANAQYIATSAKGLLRDFLCIMINTPKQPRFNELKNDALDIAEEVTKYMPTASYDPVCVSLYRCIDSSDRAHIIRALWAITHFSSEIPEAKNLAMVGVAHHYLANLATYLLVEPDSEMLNGVMDFFYQYTLDPTNAQYLPRVVNMTIMLIPRLVNLLSYEAVEVMEEVEVHPEQIAPAPTAIPKVPSELSRQLMALAEPERSSQWLRCCFVEDSDCEITQIALWQAYQIRFGSQAGALAAAEFIKNVSATFTNAQAQVVPAPGPNGQTSTRFIIKGIRPLETSLTFDGWPYLYCKWAVGDQPGQLCDRAFADPEELRKHVFEEHNDLKPPDQSRIWNWEKAMESPKTCRWHGCTRYKTPSTEIVKVINHVSTHLPQPRRSNAQPPTPKREVLQQRVVRRQPFRNTPVNEVGEPVGVAYKAALILRNLLEHLPEDVYVAGSKDITVPKGELFLARIPTIMDKYAENRSLRVPMNDVISLIQKYRPGPYQQH
jgi:chromatin structure-remodeling complex subunit RSC9